MGERHASKIETQKALIQVIYKYQMRSKMSELQADTRRKDNFYLVVRKGFIYGSGKGKARL